MALAAQGFDRPRPRRPPGPRDVARVLRQLGLLQIDFVNVLAPAHYQVPFSRLGPYRRAHLNELVNPGRQAKPPAPPFTKQWAHEASIVPVETWPLLRHRMEGHRVRPHFGRGLLGIADRRPNFARVYDMSERIVPPQHHTRQVDGVDAQRELLRLAGRKLGIAVA